MKFCVRVSRDRCLATLKQIHQPPLNELQALQLFPPFRRSPCPATSLPQRLRAVAKQCGDAKEFEFGADFFTAASVRISSLDIRHLDRCDIESLWPAGSFIRAEAIGNLLANA